MTPRRATCALVIGVVACLVGMFATNLVVQGAALGIALVIFAFLVLGLPRDRQASR